MRTFVGLATLSVLASAVAADEAPKPPAADPVVERAGALKEAAGLLEKAGAARGRGSRSFAEQLFSSAELIVGPEAVAELAPLFREGAPPRVTTAPKPVKEEAPQPAAVGNSEDDEPDPRPPRGSLGGVITAAGKPVDGFAVVTVEPASGKWRRRAPRQRVMEQRQRQFAPRIMVVPLGSTVSFPNFDPVYHNVFSTSEAKPFDLGIYRKDNTREMTFDKEGIVSISCNLHANMSAHVVVVSAPHYAITDDKGRFNFKSLEPGSYRVRAWGPRSIAPAVRELVVKADKNTVALDIKADAPTGPSPDKFGVSRGGTKP